MGCAAESSDAATEEKKQRRANQPPPALAMSERAFVISFPARFLDSQRATG
jgi:hypothetical protein